MATKTKLTLFQRAERDLPACDEQDAMRQKTLDDLRWAVRIQLDLIEEGQDSAEGDDPRPLRRWLKKYGDPAK